jgi:hypothetical protein
MRRVGHLPHPAVRLHFHQFPCGAKFTGVWQCHLELSQRVFRSRAQWRGAKDSSTRLCNKKIVLDTGVRLEFFVDVPHVSAKFFLTMRNEIAALINVVEELSLWGIRLTCFGRISDAFDDPPVNVPGLVILFSSSLGRNISHQGCSTPRVYRIASIAFKEVRRAKETREVL